MLHNLHDVLHVFKPILTNTMIVFFIPKLTKLLINDPKRCELICENNNNFKSGVLLVHHLIGSLVYASFHKLRLQMTSYTFLTLFPTDYPAEFNSS